MYQVNLFHLCISFFSLSSACPYLVLYHNQLTVLVIHFTPLFGLYMLYGFCRLSHEPFCTCILTSSRTFTNLWFLHIRPACISPIQQELFLCTDNNHLLTQATTDALSIITTDLAFSPLKGNSLGNRDV